MAQLEWDDFLEGWVCSNCGDDVCRVWWRHAIYIRV